MNKQDVIVGTSAFFDAMRSEDMAYVCIECLKHDGANSVYVFNGSYYGVGE